MNSSDLIGMDTFSVYKNVDKFIRFCQKIHENAKFFMEKL